MVFTFYTVVGKGCSVKRVAGKGTYLLFVERVVGKGSLAMWRECMVGKGDTDLLSGEREGVWCG